MGRAGSDYSSDVSERSDLSDDDSYEASVLYGGTDDTRLCSRKDMSVVVRKGRAWIATGFTRGSQHLAFIEEVVFMVEQGSLILLEGERVVHLLEAYSLVSSPLYGCSWDNYQVYRYLRKLGYIVGHHNVLWTLPKKRPPMLEAEVKNLNGQFNAVMLIEGAQENDKISELLTQSSSHLKGVNSKNENNDGMSATTEMRLMYDEHIPNERFKKSNPGLPIFSLCTTSGHPPH